jgi:hypothetical protein
MSLDPDMLVCVLALEDPSEIEVPRFGPLPAVELAVDIYAFEFR